MFDFLGHGINGEYFNEIVDNLLNVDPFRVLADFVLIARLRFGCKEFITIVKDGVKCAL